MQHKAILQKSLAILISAIMIISATACGVKPTNTPDQTEGKYPINWNGTIIYADYNAWLSDYAKIEDYPNNFEQYRGKLNTVEGLFGFLELYYNLDYSAIFDKLYIFANYGNAVFPSNSLYKQCLAKLDTHVYDWNTATAYFDEEMGNMTLDERIALFSDDNIKKYAYQFRTYLDPNQTFLSENESNIRNTLGLSHGRMETLFNILAFTEIPDVEYKLSNGKTIFINDVNLSSYLSDASIKESEKAAIYDAWWGHIAEYADTLAYILETEMLEEYAQAKTNNYDSTLEWAMASEDIPVVVMEQVLNAAHRGAPRFAEYFQLYSDGEYHIYDEYKSLSKYTSPYISYDDGVDLVLDALSVLGDDYTENFKAIINSGFVDVYPKEGKTGGAFEWGGFYGLTPFVMFNYTGDLNSVANIAHEGGHACYDLYTMQNQDYYNWSLTIFTQEIASITNELLFFNYIIEHAKSNDEKIYYLGQLLARWTGNFFRQCYFQDFENYCHEQVESGNILDSQDLADKYLEITTFYYGENLTMGEYGNYRWANLSHLYYNHYVYKYATSVCYASAIAQAILSGDTEMTAKYIEFLKAGSSCSPSEALAIMGIDITSEQVYDDALNYFYGLLNEYENLLKK